MNNSQTLRDTDAYKRCTAFSAASIAEGLATTDDETRFMAAWQYLHDTGLAYQLQGWFGRTAQAYLRQGLIIPLGV